MSTYVFGDIQGCYDEMQILLEQADFNPSSDRLWFVGDLINRGPRNLKTLEFIMGLTDPVVVLGNHDLHFLAIATETRRASRKETIYDVLPSSHLQEIIDWLRQQPLLHYDEETGYVMVHAGIPPNWDLATSLARAGEVEAMLSGPDHVSFFSEMYGDTPAVWHDSLQGMDRLRIITNCFTRLRYCTEGGQLELRSKTNVKPEGFAPWYSFPRQGWGDISILFGHWAALGGGTNDPQAIALDTGCVWGRSLTALRLDDGQLFSTPALRSYQG